MLYVIGLGLGDEKDISVKGLEAVKKCDKVYIEAYTSLLSFGISSSGISTLEEFYGKPVIVADREMVEERADNMLLESRTFNVAFLVVGDPFGATTHTDLVVRAKKEGIEVKVIHNASVMNAVGVCGLQLYSYGETVSIPFFTDTWRPDSFYEKIKRNRSLELHTLCLLDIRVKEPSMESLARGFRYKDLDCLTKELMLILGVGRLFLSITYTTSSRRYDGLLLHCLGDIWCRKTLP
ncbi:diphthine methyl ester synthase [Ranunculus cassubicifolius]